MLHKNKKGFTLIEMLIVIAIIAVLVAIVIPTVSSSTNKAKAAADAANLRSILAVLNVIVIDHNGELNQADLEGMNIPASKTFPDANIKVEFCRSHYIKIFYHLDGAYYGLDYFTSIAESGQPDSSISTGTPATEENVTWLTTVTSSH